MHLAFLTPRDEPPGGGTDFNAGLLPALRGLGHRVDTPDAGEMAGAIAAGARLVVDGLLLPDLEADLDALVAADAVAVVHHLGARAGRDPSARAAVLAIERRMLPRLRRVVATSAPVAERLVAEYGVVAPILFPPGLPRLARSQAGGVHRSGCRIFSLGVLTPRKGHDRLLRALARLGDLDWTLVVAGDATRDPVHAAAIGALIEELGLGGRVTLLCSPGGAALEAEWEAADLFALASSWEGHPAAIALALRRGIPVLALAVGGVVALVPHSAGILCVPKDAATLSKSLRRAIHDRALRAALAEGAWEAGAALPGWDDRARAFEAILEDIPQ